MVRSQLASRPDSADIAHARLARQRLVGTHAATAHEAVAAMGALQAQDYGSVLWAIGVRTHAQTRAQVEQALAARQLVRSWPLRGTLHVVAAEDLRSLLALTGPYALAKSAQRRSNLGLTPAVLRRAEKLLVRALEGGKQATREELAAALTRGGVDADSQRTYHLLFYFSTQALTCFGPHRGKEPTFVLLDEWLPAGPASPADVALAGLAARYLATRAPATPQDFAWWSGLPVPRARSALASVAAPPPALPVPAATALLLPAFDEYALSYRDRSAVLAAAHAKAIVPGGNGIFLPMIVLDGQIVGTWKRSETTKRVKIALAPFQPLKPRAGRALERAATRLGAFLEAHVEIA